ncbi:unnamed protein product [Pleuronectes platessa]|uniref:C2H2-type domain-containing protein n=1 Tax=Pleuronectes platessa TaxID=8262 RepID=A0A9N7UMQ9_PLEPL|nr:unnamed protein product [Pleuronectes platessa]
MPCIRRAKLDPLAGHIRPTGRMFGTPGLSVSSPAEHILQRRCAHILRAHPVAHISCSADVRKSVPVQMCAHPAAYIRCAGAHPAVHISSSADVRTSCCAHLCQRTSCGAHLLQRTSPAAHISCSAHLLQRTSAVPPHILRRRCPHRASSIPFSSLQRNVTADQDNHIT